VTLPQSEACIADHTLRDYTPTADVDPSCIDASLHQYEPVGAAQEVVKYDQVSDMSAASQPSASRSTSGSWLYEPLRTLESVLLDRISGSGSNDDDFNSAQNQYNSGQREENVGLLHSLMSGDGAKTQLINKEQ
jgi:hypothetical protein